MARKTIKRLEADLAELTATAEEMTRRCADLRQERDDYKRRLEEAREQFADLKKRVHNSETEVARLNGYLARVREDDIAREELITVGEPGGEQRLVPKRKHEYLGQRETSDIMAMTDGYGRRQKPKHWIEY